MIGDFIDDKGQYEQLLDSYIQYSDVFEPDEIVALNSVFENGMKFFGIERTLPELISAPVVKKSATVFSPEEYADIIHNDFLQAKVREMELELSDLRQQIEKLDIPPKSWEGTKKEWKDSKKKKRNMLSEKRDNLSQQITRTKNDDLTEKEKTLLDSQIQERYKATSGLITEEELERYIKHLEAISFEKVKGLDYFPTPPDVVEKVLDKAQLKANQRILEPSAGKGNIADAVRSRMGNSVKIDVCELSDHNRKILELKGYTVVSQDFLEYGVKDRTKTGLPIMDEKIKYDRIVMNPPYMQGVDWAHIQHAFAMLKPNGILVAVVPGKSYIGLGREATEKRLFIEANDGTIDIIPASEYNQQMEFTSLSIDIGIVTMFKKVREEFVSSGTRGDLESDSKYQELPKTGSIEMPERPKTKVDTQYVKPEIVMASAHLVPPESSIPDYVGRIRSTKLVSSLFAHQRYGANLAIHALISKNTGNGFLLEDGTGAGKTIQMLTVAAYMYQEYKMPIVLFTTDDRVIKTSFMQDGMKMGFPVPEYTPVDKLTKHPPRPKNYTGLYDKIEPVERLKTVLQDELPPIFFGDERSFYLKDGINIFKYTSLSNIKVSEENNKGKAKANAESNHKFWTKIYQKGRAEIKGKHFDFLGKVFNGELPKSQDDKYSLWGDLIQAAELDDTFQLQNQYAELFGRLDANNMRIDMPSTEEASRNYVLALDRFETAIKTTLTDVINKTSLVIFDEGHKIKNLLLGMDKQAGRAFYAKFITDNAKRIMFATATPCDRPYDILYLKRIGLFQDDEDFKRRMGLIGIYYEPAKLNSRGEIVQRGKWKTSKDEESQAFSNFQLSLLFDFATRKGCMIRREIQYTNLEANFVDVVIPHSVKYELDAITESLTTIDDKGRRRVNKLKQMQRHMELIEGYKIDEAIETTKREIAEGRNVLIFTSYVDEGDEERVEDDSLKLGTVRILKNKLSKLFGEDQVGVLVSATKGYEDFRRLENVADFQSGEKRILIGTINSGGTGVNLDDQIGNAPRTIIVLTAPLSFIQIMQLIGRIVRANTKSRSRVYFYFAKTDHPDKKEAKIIIESWLKNLLGNKFRTLKAAVKGEIGVLDPDMVERMEAGGASAVAEGAEMTVATPNEHSMYTKTARVIQGWFLPSKIPMAVERAGNSRQHFVYIKGKSKLDLDTWAEANKEFISKWQLEKNFDTSYRRFNGSHYGREFNTSDSKNWKESYDLWNALLNVVKPEEFQYITSESAQYVLGEEVTATTDIIMTGTKKGEKGIITAILKNVVGTNKSGDIYRYEYDVMFNGRTANNLPPWEVTKEREDDELPVPMPQYKTGDIYYKFHSTTDSGYKYIKITALLYNGDGSISYEVGTDYGLSKTSFLENIKAKKHYQSFISGEDDLTERIKRDELNLYRPETALSGLAEVYEMPVPSKAIVPVQIYDMQPAKAEIHTQEVQSDGKEITPEDLGFYDYKTIMNARPNHVQLDRTYLLLEKISLPCQILIHGKQGSGKSSLGMILSEDVSKHGKVLHLLKDEKYKSGRIGQMLGRLNIDARNIMFNFKMDYNRLREFLLNNPDIEFVVIDSINEMQVQEEHIVNLLNEFPDISFILIAQSTKDGKNHSGFQNLAYKVDTEIQVAKRVAIAKKHRDGPSDVEFSILDTQNQRQLKKPIVFNGLRLA